MPTRHEKQFGDHKLFCGRIILGQPQGQ